jgi:hypothetical protein
MDASSGSDIAAISLRESRVSKRFSGIDAHWIPLNERIEDPKAHHPTYLSPHTYSKRVTVSTPCRSCSGTRTWVPPCSFVPQDRTTPTCSTRDQKPCAAQRLG